MMKSLKMSKVLGSIKKKTPGGMLKENKIKNLGKMEAAMKNSA